MRQRRSGTNRKPSKPYYEFAKPGRLDGVRIGVVREYMDKSLFSVADEETIDIVDRAIEDLRGLGATIVDPGPHGALFQECVDVVSPVWRNRLFIGQFPAVFPPGADHIPLLVDMYFDPSLVPHNANGQPSIRNLGSSGGDTGDTRYNMNAYLKGRGDPEIQTLTDMINKANFWTDPVIPNRRASLVNADQDTTFSNASALQTRFTLQAVVFQCFARYALDAVVYPTGNIPPAILTAPQEPSVNDRSSGLWTYINSRGFPAMTVPAGFTTMVYDRGDSGELLPAIPAELPVGIDFLGLPFSEPTLFAIGAAYEAATQHRTPPPDFEPLDAGGKPPHGPKAHKPRKMPVYRAPSVDEEIAVQQD